MTIVNNIEHIIPIFENNESTINIPEPGEWRDRLNQDIEDFKNDGTPHLVHLLMFIAIMKPDINLLQWTIDHGVDTSKQPLPMEITILRAYGFNIDLN